MSDQVQTPSVGRIVHVRVGDQPQCVAAIVTSYQPARHPTSGQIMVTMFPPGTVPVPALHFLLEEGVDPNRQGPFGTWHWPERVGPPLASDPIPAIPRPERTPGQ